MFGANEVRSERYANFLDRQKTSREHHQRRPPHVIQKRQKSPPLVQFIKCDRVEQLGDHERDELNQSKSDGYQSVVDRVRIQRSILGVERERSSLRADLGEAFLLFGKCLLGGGCGGRVVGVGGDRCREFRVAY